jgi:hypothetical protein
MKSLLFTSLFLISFNYCFSSTLGNTEKETTPLNCNKYESLFGIDKIKKVIDESFFTSNFQMLKTNLLHQNESLLLGLNAIQKNTVIDAALQQEFDKYIDNDY